METNETKEQKSTNSNDQCTMKEGSKFIYIHEGIQFDKILWKTPYPKKNQILYGNAPITNYRHIPLLLNANMVLALNVSDI